MQVYVGIVLGLIMGAVSATAWTVSAQSLLSQPDASLSQRLDDLQLDQQLSLQRELERFEAPSRADNPCRR